MRSCSCFTHRSLGSSSPPLCWGQNVLILNSQLKYESLVVYFTHAYSVCLQVQLRGPRVDPQHQNSILYKKSIGLYHCYNDFLLRYNSYSTVFISEKYTVWWFVLMLYNISLSNSRTPQEALYHKWSTLYSILHIPVTLSNRSAFCLQICFFWTFYVK